VLQRVLQIADGYRQVNEIGASIASASIQLPRKGIDGLDGGDVFGFCHGMSRPQAFTPSVECSDPTPQRGRGVQ